MSRTLDMTTGVIWKKILLFSVPLLLGNMFQQLYNTVDSIILGNFVGKEALAAAGCTSSVCATVINFYNGIALGAGVVAGFYFGEKNRVNLQKTIVTALMISLLAGIVMTVLSIPAGPWFLRMMATPDEMFEMAAHYLQIFFIGTIFLFVYNTGGGLLRAMGDSKTPLYCLIATSFLNIVLDLFFVLYLHMGIEGTAIATVIAEAVSALMIMGALWRVRDVWQEEQITLSIDEGMTRRILRVGIPTGVQQALTSFSNALLFSYVNAFNNTSITAGWSAHVKLDQFAILPAQSIGQAITTFVSQNIGAKDPKRAKEGTGIAIKMGILAIGMIALLILLFAPVFVRLFNPDEEVIYYGSLFLRVMALFRILTPIFQGGLGALRGLGKSKTAMAIMVFSLVFARQGYLYLITQVWNSVYAVALGYPVAWVVCDLILLVYFLRFDWEAYAERRVV